MHFVHLMSPCIKHYKHHIFIGMCSLFTVSIANTKFLLMKTHRVLNRWKNCGNVCYCKNQVFL